MVNNDAGWFSYMYSMYVTRLITYITWSYEPKCPRKVIIKYVDEITIMKMFEEYNTHRFWNQNGLYKQESIDRYSLKDFLLILLVN